MILEEYDEELHMKTLYEQGVAAGEARGKAAGLAEGKAAGLAEGKAAGLAEGKAAGVQAFRQALLQFISPKWQVSEKLAQKIQKENSGAPATFRAYHAKRRSETHYQDFAPPLFIIELSWY